MEKNYIAGWNTPADWYVIRARLEFGKQQGWTEAYTDFFRTRLELRYLRPIKVLQDNDISQGEGFSILAIQCSLIEFLESTTQGTSYRYVRRGEKISAYEYSSSQAIFIAFLRDRAPFCKAFDEATALDFYINVRCGLLHEARTKNGWRIWAENQRDVIADTSKRIVYRNNFQNALISYIDAYGKILPFNQALQEAFVRKFDSLCI